MALIKAQFAPGIDKQTTTYGAEGKWVDSKNILDSITLPYQFDAAEMREKGVNKIQITQEVVDKGSDPVLLFNKPNAKKQQIK